MNWLSPSRALLITSLAIPAFASVTVSSPSNGGSVTSPVNFVASSTTSCSKGVASMGVYVDGKLQKVVDGHQMNASVSISDGSHKTVVEEWDHCGGASYAVVNITVKSGGQPGVTVTAPSDGGSVGQPVNYVASASSSCAQGVASMGIYVNNNLKYVVKAASLNTNLNLDAGKYHTVVEEWDHCGGAAYKAVDITVSGGGGGGGGGDGQFTDLQASKGWIVYGEYPPKYAICTKCGGGVTWSVNQHQGSPSMSGNSTEYGIGGDHPYSDVLFTLPLIGTHSTQGMPDSDHKIIPTLHNFTYDAYFYSGDISLSQVLEFDINQYFNGMGYVYGHQCKIAGGHEWDIWDNVNKHWVHTGIACNPVSNGWNHVHLEVERTSDNKMLYKTITFNGDTHTINQSYGHFNSGKWYGLGVNYQMDGNSKQADYKTYMDKFTFTYQ